MATATLTFGDELRRWREARRLSQLDLALHADVSQRHVSFLETGRSTPSRDMVLHLAAALDVPLRDRNLLLTLAGYAPAFSERTLDDATLAQIRHVLETLLAAHEPFPAYVVDRTWNQVLANTAIARLLQLLPDPLGAAEAAAGNVLRLALHPDGLRQVVVNFPEVAASLLLRLEHEATHRAGDPEIQALLAEVRSYPGVAELPSRPSAPRGQDLLVPLHVRNHDVELRLFTTIATIGAPYDVTLEELCLETLLPADPATEQALRELAEAG